MKKTLAVVGAWGVLALTSQAGILSDTRNFESASDLLVFDNLTTNGVLGVESTVGVGGGGGAVFSSTTPVAGGPEDQRILFTTKQTFANNLVSTYSASMAISAAQLFSVSPVTTFKGSVPDKREAKSKTKLRIGFLGGTENLPIDKGAPKTQDAWKQNGGFFAEVEMKYSESEKWNTTTSSWDFDKQSLEFKTVGVHGDGGNSESKFGELQVKLEKGKPGTLQSREDFAEDFSNTYGLSLTGWFELRLDAQYVGLFEVGGLQYANYAVQYALYDLGLDGLGTPVLASYLNPLTGQFVNLSGSTIGNSTNFFNDQSAHVAFLVEGEKASSALSFFDSFTYSIETTAVPEPGVLGLAALGAMALAWRMRKR